jgi:hypothetical protein
MVLIKGLASSAALVSLICTAQATTLYSINWLSDPRPCVTDAAPSLPGPIVSKYYPECRYPGFEMPLSICPGQMRGHPWDNGRPILIIGYHLSVILSSPDAGAIVEIGTASDYPSADVFATASGTGTFTSKEWYPPGVGVPVGGETPRIDVYARCSGTGTFSVLATIFYTILRRGQVDTLNDLTGGKVIIQPKPRNGDHDKH